MKKSLVSIIMATHNDALFVSEAIKSVLNQSYSNYEFIIIDDGSSDDTSNILVEFRKKDKRIIIITNDEKIGLSNSLNKGVRKAQGEYVARIDSDDIWEDKFKIESQVEFLSKNPKYGLVGSWAKKIDSKGKILSLMQYPVSDEDIRQYILLENCFIHSSVLIRTSLLEASNAFDSRYRYAQDYDLWLRIGKMAKFYNLPSFMVLYRKNPLGMSHKHYKTQINETIKIVKTHRKDYPNPLTFIFLWYSRLFLPRTFRENMSKLYRNLLFFNVFRARHNQFIA